MTRKLTMYARRMARVAPICLLLAACGKSEPVMTVPPAPDAPPSGDCADHAQERRAYFGDLHVHTQYSFDSSLLFGTRTGPREAYAFARGGAILLPMPRGAEALDYALERPLDFSTVTDHAEYFGAGIVFGAPPGVTIWQDTQAAAAEANEPCVFTSFVGYEWTAQPGDSNLHRNVIFRGDRVAEPVSSRDTDNDARQLWARLRADCLDAGTGCDVLTIPHNANVSNGLMFTDPADAQEARDRQFFEPLIEITQHKGASECRFDATFGRGVDTTDEQCAFEQVPGTGLIGSQHTAAGSQPPPEDFSPRAFARSVLKDGLKIEQQGLADVAGGLAHVNPFKLGFIGSSDTHNSTPGATEEARWHGHHGNSDGTAAKRLSDTLVSNNAGGLAVVWAEENTRESLFAALRRRETYGTSGTRPLVRFFGGWDFPEQLCGNPQLVRSAYARGVPMGADLPDAPAGAGAPQFVAWALQDPGTTRQPGNALQRLQIVKGWVDAGGATHEKVYDIAPTSPSTDRSVDPQTCRAVVTGASELCTVWRDPDFRAGDPAMYYLRVLEDPSCRWSVHDCRAVGVDPFAAQCESQPSAADYPECCGAHIDPVIQERAWASPIWYRPER